MAGISWTRLIHQSCSLVIECYLLFATEQTEPDDNRNKLYLPVLNGAENSGTLV
jgi:hypothetical protein